VLILFLGFFNDGSPTENISLINIRIFAIYFACISWYNVEFATKLLSEN